MISAIYVGTKRHQRSLPCRASICNQKHLPMRNSKHLPLASVLGRRCAARIACSSATSPASARTHIGRTRRTRAPPRGRAQRAAHPDSPANVDDFSSGTRHLLAASLPHMDAAQHTPERGDARPALRRRDEAGKVAKPEDGFVRRLRVHFGGQRTRLERHAGTPKSAWRPCAVSTCKVRRDRQPRRPGAGVGRRRVKPAAWRHPFEPARFAVTPSAAATHPATPAAGPCRSASLARCRETPRVAESCSR